MKPSLCIALLCMSATALATLWSDPVLLSELNTPSYTANDPFLTSDGLTMYFCRNGSDDNSRIMKATRSSLSDPFTSISQISELYVGKRLYSPWVSEDGLRMYYARHEDTRTKTWLRLATRSSVNDPWQDVMAFDAIHQEFIYDSYCSLAPDELTLYYSRFYDDAYHIWKATRNSIGEQFSNPVAVSELNDGTYSYAPYIMPDELTIFYSAIRDGHDILDLYAATRSSLNDPFGNIEQLITGTDNNAKGQPFVTADYSTLYFSTPEGIWMSTQVPEPAACLLLLAGSILAMKKGNH